MKIETIEMYISMVSIFLPLVQRSYGLNPHPLKQHGCSASAVDSGLIYECHHRLKLDSLNNVTIKIKGHSGSMHNDTADLNSSRRSQRVLKRSGKDT